MINIQTIELGSMNLSSYCFSIDNKYLACGKYREIKIIDRLTAKQIGYDLRGHKASIWSLKFSADNQLLVSGSADMTVRVWDVNNSKQIGEPLVGHTKAVTAVSFAPNGLFVASASNDNSIIIWNIQNRREPSKCIFMSENQMWINTLEYSKRFIIFYSEQTIGVCKTEIGQLFARKFFNDDVNTYHDKVCSQKLTLNKKVFASLATNKIVRIWDSSSKKQINRFIVKFDYISKFEFSCEMNEKKRFELLENCSNNRLKYNPYEKQSSNDIKIMEYSIQISPDNRYIVFGSQTNTQGNQYGTLHVHIGN